LLSFCQQTYNIVTKKREEKVSQRKERGEGKGEADGGGKEKRKDR